MTSLTETFALLGEKRKQLTRSLLAGDKDPNSDELSLAKIRRELAKVNTDIDDIMDEAVARDKAHLAAQEAEAQKVKDKAKKELTKHSKALAKSADDLQAKIQAIETSHAEFLQACEAYNHSSRVAGLGTIARLSTNLKPLIRWSITRSSPSLARSLEIPRPIGNSIKSDLNETVRQLIGE